MKTWLSIPHQVRNRGVRLLDQQMWLFGCDVRNTQENLLLRYGLTRQRPPEGEKGFSQYSAALPDGGKVILWGFGMYFAAAPEEGLFLRRYEFSPRLMRTPQFLWKSEQLPESVFATTQQQSARILALLPQALRWLAAYETWVLREVGCAYRKWCLDGWVEAAVAEPEAIVQDWELLAENCERLPSRSRGAC